MRRPHLVATPVTRCWVCADKTAPDPASYAQLLGLYLGDGWLGRMANGTYVSISCADRWPGVALECADVLRLVLARRVSTVKRRGSHDIKAYSRPWPCLFPQHGPGKKHDRPIVLEPWQQAIVDEHPGRLLQGLFHSDG